MNVNRLRALSTRLHAYAGPFDLSSWTTCACGIAARMPEFNILGFSLENVEWCSGINLNLVEPTYQDYRGWEAVMAFFDLDDQTAIALFYLDKYSYGRNTSAATVANRIDRYIDQYKAKRVNSLREAMLGGLKIPATEEVSEVWEVYATYEV